MNVGCTDGLASLRRVPAQTRPLRIAVVNDYEVVVTGVAALLAPYASRVEVVECDVRSAPVSDVDVILFDTFGNPRERGVGIEELVRSGDAKVVVFSWSADPGVVARTLERGAAGYIAKGADAETIVSGIEAAYAGVPDLLVDPDPAEPLGGWPGQPQGLTAREAEVLSLITQGLSNQEIADRCYLSINSVKTYIRTAYRKMGVTRRSQAVLWGLAHGFEPDHFRRVDHEV